MGKIYLLMLTIGCLIGCGTAIPSSNMTAPVSPTPTPTVVDVTPPDNVSIPWKQTIGSTNYRWNGKDLFVRRSKGSETSIFPNALRKYRASFPTNGRKCLLDSFFNPAAVVGDLVSYEHESGFGGVNCGVESGEWRYATVDVSNPTRFLDLRSFFTEDRLLRAFLANSQLSSDIQKSISDKKLDAVPATLKDLSAFLTRYDYQIFNGDSYYEPDYLQRFVFHHLEGETICIRVSTTSTSNAGRAIHQYAEIFLPIPGKLRDPFKKADAGDAGFLMKDAETKVGTKAATFESKF